MNITRFKCVICGKLTAGRMPPAHGRHYGDTTTRYPRRHNVNGKPCPGNIVEAEWVDAANGRATEERTNERTHARQP